MIATTPANASDPGIARDIRTGGDPQVQATWAARARDAGIHDDLIKQALASTREALHAACSTLLYLCAEDRDIVNPDEPPETAAWTPTTPRPAARPLVWEVGWRLGTALRNGRGRTSRGPRDGGSDGAGGAR